LYEAIGERLRVLFGCLVRGAGIFSENSEEIQRFRMRCNSMWITGIDGRRDDYLLNFVREQAQTIVLE
jgi:hypothetical protein